MADEVTPKKIESKLESLCETASRAMADVEGLLRLGLGDRLLAQQMSQLSQDFLAARHDVAVCHWKGPVASRLQGQVPATANRESVFPLAKLRITNLQNQFRLIEESSRNGFPDLCQQVEQFRYRVSSLEMAITTAELSSKVFADIHLCVLIGMSHPSEPLAEEKLTVLVKQLVASQVGMIQLRDKRLTARALVRVGRIIADVTSGTKSRLIINDRPDIALAVGADGVHLGQDDLSIFTARRILGAGRIVGVSTHSIKQARHAVLDGANYIGVGPVFPSQTKSFDSFVGLQLVREVAEEIQLPAFAIGGIDMTNVNAIINSGMPRVAVSGAVSNARHPGAVAKKLRIQLKQADADSSGSA